MTMKNLTRLWAVIKNIIFSHKIASSIVVAVIVSVLWYFFTKSAEDITIQYGRVRKGSVSQVISGTGQVSATSQVDLKPKVNANVTQVLVGPGDKVVKGQVLFRLDARDAYKQVRDAQLSLDQAKIALAKLTQPAETIDVLTLENAIKKSQIAKETQDTTVATAYSNLLNGSLQAIPDVSYTQETAPTISGTYLKKAEGQIRIGVNQGTEGSLMTISGLYTGTIQYSSSVGQPIGDTGLYIKFNSPQSYVNWIIDIPNKRSTSYLSLYNAYINAQQNRDIANADSDRQIAEYTQKLVDLKKGAKDVDIQAQELSVEQRQNALADANNTLSDYTITAPFSGTMASVSAQVGLSAVTAASNGATSLGTIVTDQKIAEITLNETDIAKVHLGQAVNITFDALDGVTATGTVADIDGVGTVTQGVVTYKVKIYFNATDDRIKPSMTVSTDIITNSKDGVLTLPTSAIKRDSTGYYVESDGSVGSMPGARNGQGTTTRRFTRASSTGEGGAVRNNFGSTTRQMENATIPSTTVLTKIPITIGMQGGSVTEILEGLTEGQRVIVKKTNVTTANKTAPSVTSLLRPGGTTGRTGSTASATTRPQ